MWGKVRTYGLTRLLGGGGLVVVFLTPGCVTESKWEPVPAKVTTKVYDQRGQETDGSYQAEKDELGAASIGVLATAK